MKKTIINPEKFKEPVIKNIFSGFLILTVILTGCTRYEVQQKSSPEGKVTVFLDPATRQTVYEDVYDQKGVKTQSRYFRNTVVEYIDYYHPDGSLKNSEWYFADGKKKCQFYYEKNGNLSSELFYNQSGKVLYYHDMSYNTANLKVRETIYNENKPLYLMTYEYANDRTLVLQKQYDSSNHMISMYEFSNKEEFVKITRYQPDGKISSEEIYHSKADQKDYIYYNSSQIREASISTKGNELIYTEYSADGLKKLEYVFDIRGIKKEYLIYHNGIIESKIEYNSKGNESRNSVYDANGKLLYYVEYIYDSRGIVTGIRSYNADGRQIKNMF